METLKTLTIEQFKEINSVGQYFNDDTTYTIGYYANGIRKIGTMIVVCTVPINGIFNDAMVLAVKNQLRS